MDDRLALADAVGVLDINTRYLRQLERIHQHQRRKDYIKGAVVFSALFACYILMVLWIGTP
ncbi:hypothetical protein [uncultured Corynebacterium sp.]|uniref:hypothetical protein n=1 Tax=uncultured Corynebacterium sp. TaxID=159447 RepID=UPI0025F44CAF|nr:hypothetical protein [uncultured Corynebacterium sp.]